jgi:hypothetical protein
MPNFRSSGPDTPDVNNEIFELVLAGVQCLCAESAAFTDSAFDPAVSTLFVEGLLGVDSVARADSASLSLSPTGEQQIEFGSKEAALLTVLCSRKSDPSQFLRFVERTLAARGVALLHVRALPDSFDLLRRAGYRFWVPGLEHAKVPSPALKFGTSFPDFGESVVMSKTLSLARRRVLVIPQTAAPGCETRRRSPPQDHAQTEPRPACRERRRKG